MRSRLLNKKCGKYTFNFYIGLCYHLRALYPPGHLPRGLQTMAFRYRKCRGISFSLCFCNKTKLKLIRVPWYCILFGNHTNSRILVSTTLKSSQIRHHLAPQDSFINAFHTSIFFCWSNSFLIILVAKRCVRCRCNQWSESLVQKQFGKVKTYFCFQVMTSIMQHHPMFQ